MTYRTPKIVCLSTLIIASGCASTQTPAIKTYFPTEMTVQEPKVGVGTSVEIGESLMFWKHGPAQEFIGVKKQVQFEYQNASLSLDSGDYKVTGIQGSKLTASVTKLKNGSVTIPLPQNSAYIALGPDGCFFVVEPTLVLAPSKRTTPTEGISGIFSGERAIFGSGGAEPTKVDLGSEVCSLQKEIVAHPKDSFKKELLYLGKSGNTINLTYREFSDNFARPAFTNNLQYDLGDGNVIGYQGARFKVISADNTSITYEVIKHLN